MSLLYSWLLMTLFIISVSLPLLIFNWTKFHFIHTPTATCLYRRSLYDPTTLRILSIVSKTCWWFFMNYIVSGLIFVFLLLLPGPCAQSSAGCLQWCRGPQICYWWYWFYNKRSNRFVFAEKCLKLSVIHKSQLFSRRTDVFNWQ